MDAYPGLHHCICPGLLRGSQRCSRFFWFSRGFRCPEASLHPSSVGWANAVGNELWVSEMGQPSMFICLPLNGIKKLPTIFRGKKKKKNEPVAGAHLSSWINVTMEIRHKQENFFQGFYFISTILFVCQQTQLQDPIHLAFLISKNLVSYKCLQSGTNAMM